MSGLVSRLKGATTSKSRTPSPPSNPTTSTSDTSASDPSAIENDKYRLLVTAGPSYNTQTHKLVHVNTSTPTLIENEYMRIAVKVRIRGFRGLPSSSPGTSPYFSQPPHEKDQYSIAFSFVPKVDIPAKDVIWGNDFDHPVRDRLPPGFNTAFKIVKEWIDPGLECDAYADEPYLIGPALSCWFAFHVGETLPPDSPIPVGETEEEDILHEGSTGSGAEIREKLNIPPNNEKRRKHFLNAQNREALTFEKGRLYSADFYNPYLDFGNFALKLPGFSIKVIKYIDEKSHTLRYVMRERGEGGRVFMSVNLNLLWGDTLKEISGGDKEALGKLAGAEGREAGSGSEKHAGVSERANGDGVVRQEGAQGAKDEVATS